MRIMFIVNDLGINEPFGPMILSAVVKAKGHETILGVLKKEDVLAKIKSWKPDMIAYSMMSVDMADMKAFNDRLRKEKKIFTIIGGAHATLRRNVIADPHIDAVIIGEGEGPILDIVECLEKGKSLEGIQNVQIEPGDAPPPTRRLIENMDEIPWMDRELVYSYPEMGRFGIKGIYTNRGCAFPCPYCFNNRWNQLFKGKGKVVRRRSVDNVIAETKELVKNYRVDFIRIQDDVFLYRVDDWLKEFAEKWPREVGIPFYALLRSELISDEMAHWLKKAGCFSICMSIEHANDEIRTKMMRRKMDQEKMANAFAILKKHKLNVYANTMMALPFTTLKHDIESVDFVIKVKPDMPNFSIFMPYPGTDLGDYCRQEGIYDPEEGDVEYGMRNMSPLKCFTDKEKRAQYNLCQLAIVAVKFPILRNFIINKAIHWAPNKIFFFIHYLFAVSSYGTKIFPYEHSFSEYIELFMRTLKHYYYDFLSAPQSQGNKIKEKKLKNGEQRENAKRGVLKPFNRIDELLSDFFNKGKKLTSEKSKFNYPGRGKKSQKQGKISKVERVEEMRKCMEVLANNLNMG